LPLRVHGPRKARDFVNAVPVNAKEFQGNVKIERRVLEGDSSVDVDKLQGGTNLDWCTGESDTMDLSQRKYRLRSARFLVANHLRFVCKARLSHVVFS